MVSSTKSKLYLESSSPPAPGYIEYNSKILFHMMKYLQERHILYLPVLVNHVSITLPGFDLCTIVSQRNLRILPYSFESCGLKTTTV